MEKTSSSSLTRQEILFLLRESKHRLATVYNQTSIQGLSEEDWHLLIMCLSLAVNALAAGSTILADGLSDAALKPLTINSIISSLSHMITTTTLRISKIVSQDCETSTKGLEVDLVKSASLLAQRLVTALEDITTTLSTSALRFLTSKSTQSRMESPITSASPSPEPGSKGTC